MTYASFIKEKEFAWGGRALGASFPAHGAVSIVGSVSGGARLAGSEMLADAHASLLLEGTEKYAKKDIQIMLDNMGASLSFSIAGDRLAWSARVREASLDKLLSLIAEALLHPAFPEAEIRAYKSRAQAELGLEAQNTRTQATIGLSRILFSPNHPNWEETTEASREALKKITRKDLMAYHAQAIDGSSLVLSIAGDITPTKVFALAEKHFKRLPRKDILLPTFTAASPAAPQKALAILKDKASIDYMIGLAPGITKNHKDYPALLLGINILGNMRGFSGRLMKTVREKEGLTYGVYSYLSGFSSITDGMLVAWGTFAPQLFEKGRAAMKREIALIVKKGVTSIEAKKHREMYAAAWHVQLSTSEAIARAAHDAIVDNRGVSYLDTFPKKILKITPAEINRALKKYLKLEYLSESAAGPVEKNLLRP
jgi:zinc protease